MGKKMLSFIVLAALALSSFTACQTEGVFHYGIDFDQGIPDSAQWTFSASPDTCVIVEYDPDGGLDSSGCIHIISQVRTDAYASRKLTGLDPDRLYRMTAQVRTVGVSAGRGAVLHVSGEDGDQLWNASEFLYGDQDWTPVYVDFYPTQDGTAEISCRLGFPGGTYNGGKAQGEVFFDNINVTETDTSAMYFRTGTHVQLALDRDKMTLPDSVADNWLGRLDRVYEAYHQLVGSVPYEGRRIRILTTPGIEPGYWAVAGNPILWNNHVGIGRQLQATARDGDWNFGILHEMGHTFSASTILGDDPWNWNDELFANFRMSYALEQCNGQVIQRDILYQGAGIRDYYKKFYDESLGSGQARISGDALHYTFLRIKDRFGWSVFEQAFRHLYSLRADEFPPFASGYEQFSYFLEVVSRFAGEDVLQTCYTEKERSAIREALS